MSSKLGTWIWALLSLSLFLRCVFFTGLELYAGVPISAEQWAVMVIAGLGSLYFGYISFAGMLAGKDGSCQRGQTARPSKFLTWIGALFFLSIFLRCTFVLGSKLYAGESISGAPLVVVPIGLVALYICYMYFKRIFSRGHTRRSEPF
ncbi:hypothetical protein [Pseudomonas sp. CGJS7]|uniref:hypothetical protein n=1 Tax=Pseudomonas sp. CGJS7 TaxID=3109348 RepID=UPI00300A3AD2